MFFIPATYPCFIHTCTCCKMSRSLIQHCALHFNVTVLPLILLIFIVLTHHFVSVMLVIIFYCLILIVFILLVGSDVLLYFGIHHTFLQLMCYILTVGVLCLLVTIMQNCMYTQSNKNPSAWNFLSPELEVTCGPVAIIIWVVLLPPYLCIRGVSLSSIHYNHSHCIYEPKTTVHLLNLELKH
jgi:hypothetical protein